MTMTRTATVCTVDAVVIKIVTTARRGEVTQTLATRDRALTGITVEMTGAGVWRGTLIQRGSTDETAAKVGLWTANVALTAATKVTALLTVTTAPICVTVVISLLTATPALTGVSVANVLWTGLTALTCDTELVTVLPAVTVATTALSGTANVFLVTATRRRSR